MADRALTEAAIAELKCEVTAHGMKLLLRLLAEHAALREVARAVAPAFEQRNRRQMADWEIRTADALAALEAKHPGVLDDRDVKS